MHVFRRRLLAVRHCCTHVTCIALNHLCANAIIVAMAAPYVRAISAQQTVGSCDCSQPFLPCLQRLHNLKHEAHSFNSTADKTQHSFCLGHHCLRVGGCTHVQHTPSVLAGKTHVSKCSGWGSTTTLRQEQLPRLPLPLQRR
jgi:hypothetical protein